jgi:hypothetical protein
MKAQNLEIVFSFACHLQIDLDPDPAYHFDADPDSLISLIWIRIWILDADPDPLH